MRKTLLFLLFGLLLVTLAPACSDPKGTGGGRGGTGGGVDTTDGSVVIGVTSDLRVGVDLGTLHVVKLVNGAIVDDQTFTASATSSTLALPMEIRFDHQPGGASIQAVITGYPPGQTVGALITRSASTEIVAGKALLMRVALESRCVSAPGSSGPTCTEPATCIGGQCANDHVDPSTLEPYSPSWSMGSSDPCKPPGGGAPVVIVGQGQADYLPMMDGDTAQVEQGPQGGHHIWVALRAKNLHQSGSITSVTGHFPDLGVDVGPFNVIFTMEPDEGGYCKLYGLRFQLDQQTNIDGLLGHPLDVTVTVTDSDQDVGTGTRSVVLSSTYIQ